MAGRVCVQFKDRRKASPLYPEEAILLPQTHRTMPFEQLLPELVKEFWYSLSGEVEELSDELPEHVKGIGLSINGHRAPKSGRICDLVTGDGPVNVVVTVTGADPIKIFQDNGPLPTARAEQPEPRDQSQRQAPHKPVAARGAAAVPRPLPLANGGAKKGLSLPIHPAPAFMPGMLNLSKAKRARAPEEGEVEIPATEAIEALVNADLQYVMSRCSTPADAAGGSQLFTATWLPMKPTYQRASGIKRGRYRKKGEGEDEAGTNGVKEAPRELTEEELAEKKRFRQERAKAACAKRWALARERKEAIKAGLLDPTAEGGGGKGSKKDKAAEKEFRTMKLAKPLPQVVAIPRLARSENRASVIARALAEHGGVGFTCGICGAKLTSKESAVEHHKKSKKCVKQREEMVKTGTTAAATSGGTESTAPSDVDASTEGKLVTQGTKRLSDLSVAELKAECGARGLSNQGKKSELRTRVLNDINHSTFTQQPLPAVMQAQAIMAQVQQLHNQHHHHHILAAHQQQHHQQPLSVPLSLPHQPVPHHPIPHHHQPQHHHHPQPLQPQQPPPAPRQHVFLPHSNSQFVGFQPHTQQQFVMPIRSQPPAISPAQ